MATPFAALNQACLKTFGSAVTYQRAAGGAPFPITGILQEDTHEERHQDGVSLRLFVNLADFGARPKTGELATVAGTTSYRASPNVHLVDSIRLLQV